MEGALFFLAQAEDVVDGATEKARVPFGLMGAIGESLFTLFASLTYAYLFLMTLIK